MSELIEAARARAVTDSPTHELLRQLADALEESVPKTWGGLLTILDEVYPDDVFITKPDDPKRDLGVRILSLVRYLDAERERSDASS